MYVEEKYPRSQANAKPGEWDGQGGGEKEKNLDAERESERARPLEPASPGWGEFVTFGIYMIYHVWYIHDLSRMVYLRFIKYGIFTIYHVWYTYGRARPLEPAGPAHQQYSVSYRCYHLTKSVLKGVLQQSILTHIRPLILYASDSEG